MMATMELRKTTRRQRDAFFQSILDQMIEESRLIEAKQYMQHGDTSVYEHSVRVARQSLEYAYEHKLEVNEREMIRGALLHDYFLYDWHKQETPHRLHGFFHPGTALKNAKKDIALTAIEEDIIKKHMFPMTAIPPRYKESWIVCMVDKTCSMRETLHKSSRRGYRRYTVSR